MIWCIYTHMIWCHHVSDAISYAILHSISSAAPHTDIHHSHRSSELASLIAPPLPTSTSSMSAMPCKSPSIPTPTPPVPLFPSPLSHHSGRRKTSSDSLSCSLRVRAPTRTRSHGRVRASSWDKVRGACDTGMGRYMAVYYRWRCACCRYCNPRVKTRMSRDEQRQVKTWMSRDSRQE